MRALAMVALLAVVPLVTIASTPPPHATQVERAPVKKTKPAMLSSKVTITMPGDLSFQFKPGTGSIAATTYCLACHSSAYVSTQPVLDKAHWEAEVTKMRKAYGAAIPDKDAETIVDYLTTTYGKS